MVTVLAISPHLDDAVLSYGGHLAQLCSEGCDVAVYTVFAATPEPPYSPLAERLHYLWGLQISPMEARLSEDALAMHTIGANPVHGPFLDAIYRRSIRGDWLIKPGDSLNGTFVADEPELVTKIAQKIGQLTARLKPDLIATCLAIGDHVDHVRARDAAVAAAVESGTSLQFWQDLPYGIRTSYVPPLPKGVSLGNSQIAAFGDRPWETKINAVKCYASQHRMLAHRNESIADQLHRHAHSLAGQKSSSYSELAWDAEIAVNTCQ
jgi:LmbE family N-acetylglucosaminyl deacetylase